MLLPRFARLAAVLLAAGFFGCARSGADRFTPAEDEATACVEAMLAAWRDGRPADSLADRLPAIRVADTVRKSGQNLVDFEVLSKSRASAAGWTYVVRLQLDNPPGQERARFVVVGVDPIWVFRKEDYDMLSHWEHPMDEPLPADESAAKVPGGNRPVSATVPGKPGDDT